MFAQIGGFEGAEHELRFTDIQTYAAYNKGDLVARDHADRAVQAAVFRLITNPFILDSYNEKGRIVYDGFDYYMYIGRRFVSLGTAPRLAPLPDHLRSDVQTLKDLIHKVL